MQSTAGQTDQSTGIPGSSLNNEHVGTIRVLWIGNKARIETTDEDKIRELLDLSHNESLVISRFLPAVDEPTSWVPNKWYAYGRMLFHTEANVLVVEDEEAPSPQLFNEFLRGEGAVSWFKAMILVTSTDDPKSITFNRIY